MLPARCSKVRDGGRKKKKINTPGKIRREKEKRKGKAVIVVIEIQIPYIYILAKVKFG